jgi:ribosomal protein S27E
MTMLDDLRLDGNAAAGLLSEVFTPEATTAIVACAGCGASGAVGAAHVYAHAPGLVVRCPGCSAVLMRFARIRGRLVADLRGSATLRFG